MLVCIHMNTEIYMDRCMLHVLYSGAEMYERGEREPQNHGLDDLACMKLNYM